jgi:hypothetical protein
MSIGNLLLKAIDALSELKSLYAKSDVLKKKKYWVRYSEKNYVLMDLGIEPQE